MNRNEILKAINYKGEYTKEVKKELKALLKKYHPDHYKKESDTFKLITKIKNELEDGKKLTTVEKVIKKTNPDFVSINNEINELTEKRDTLLKRKANYQDELKALYKKYQIAYDKEIDNRNDEVDASNEVLELQNKRQLFNVLLIITTLIIVIFIFTKLYYPLIITIILFIYVVYTFIHIDLTIEKHLENNTKITKNSEKNVKDISSINKEIADINKKIWDLDCEINRLYTRINLLHAKIR